MHGDKLVAAWPASEIGNSPTTQAELLLRLSPRRHGEHDFTVNSRNLDLRTKRGLSNVDRQIVENVLTGSSKLFMLLDSQLHKEVARDSRMHLFTLPGQP